jgi:endonuclease/exonuclease/phosphatase family metal-dependent hydrolase
MPSSQLGRVMTSLTVLSMNIHKGFTSFNRRFVLSELRDAVRHVGADIVCLQEVLGQHTLYAKRIAGWPVQSHYEFVADSIWPNFAYGRNAVYTHGDHGNALLSKFLILHHDNIDITVAGDEQRGMLHSIMRPAPDKPELHVICVHLGLRTRQRDEQLQQLCAAIERLVPVDAPLIVAGDFNDWRGAAHEYLQRHAGLEEVFVTSHGEAARTFPARWPVLRLDRIYLRNARVSEPLVLPRRPWSHLSDHRPVAAQIQL